MKLRGSPAPPMLWDLVTSPTDYLSWWPHSFVLVTTCCLLAMHPWPSLNASEIISASALPPTSLVKKENSRISFLKIMTPPPIRFSKWEWQKRNLDPRRFIGVMSERKAREHGIENNQKFLSPPRASRQWIWLSMLCSIYQYLNLPTQAILDSEGCPNPHPELQNHGQGTHSRMSSLTQHLILDRGAPTSMLMISPQTLDNMN